MTQFENRFERYIEKHSDRFLEELFELLRFESISGIKSAQPHRLACADWLVNHLLSIGFHSELLETSGAPIVFASRPGKREAPVLLYYGHYDLQPPGPLELWDSPPFEPEIRDGRIYARGARDNKGQFFAFLKAVEALIALGEEFPTIKIVLEGEEESGSYPTLQYISERSEHFAADLVLGFETRGVDDGRPALCLGARGFAVVELEVTGADREVHSGHYGGLIRNAVTELSCIISSLYRSDGTIAVPDYHRDLLLPSGEERSLVERFPLSRKEISAMTGACGFAGPAEENPLIITGSFPAIECTSIRGGYVGEGIRTAIPCRAQATLVLRFGPGQSGEREVVILERFLKEQVRPGVELHFRSLGKAIPGFSTSIKSPGAVIVQELVANLTGAPLACYRTGATLSVLGELQRCCGVEPLLMGFGVTDDREHAANESFRLEQFRRALVFSGHFVRRTSEIQFV